MKNLNRLGFAVTALGIALLTTAVASAHPERECRRERAERRFEAKDKNHDGFLTKDEVGPERWEHLKVADANRDAKISKAEIEQAWKDGKLRRKHEHKPQKS